MWWNVWWYDNYDYVDEYDNDDCDSSRGCTAHLLITLSMGTTLIKYISFNNYNFESLKFLTIKYLLIAI